jgi:hypothetical protein
VNTDAVAYVDNFLIPDMMTPEQFADTQRSSARTPEQRLMLAVVRDAILLYVETLRAGHAAPSGAELRTLRTDPRRRRALAAVAETEAWLSGPLDFSAQIPFEMACAALALDATAIRESLGQFKTTGKLPSLKGMREARGGRQRIGTRVRSRYEVGRPRHSRARVRTA